MKIESNPEGEIGCSQADFAVICDYPTFVAIRAECGSSNIYFQPAWANAVHPVSS